MGPNTTNSSGSPSPSEVLEQLKTLDSPWVVLRNFDAIDSSDDIDILAKDPNAIAQALNLDLEVPPWHYYQESLPDLKLRGPGLFFDIKGELHYRSMCKPQLWIPVDPVLTTSYLNGRVEEERFFRPAAEDELVHLCGHVLFDKKSVSPKYEARIYQLIKEVDKEKTLHLAKRLFFRFAPKLLDVILEGQVHNLNSIHLKFRDY